jgi:hypothetical protein
MSKYDTQFDKETCVPVLSDDSKGDRVLVPWPADALPGRGVKFPTRDGYISEVLSRDTCKVIVPGGPGKSDFTFRASRGDIGKTPDQKRLFS